MGWTGGAPRSTPASSGGLTQARSPAMPRHSKDTVAILGIDIGKNTFHLVGLNKRGAIVLRQKLSRRQLDARLANLPPCLIGMEACVGAHHLSRRLKALGHDARLMPAKYVRAFLKGNKNDYRDAEAIAEAVQRPTMRFVATKTAEQLDLQALHRMRSRLIGERTAIANEIRAFLLDRGIAVAQGLHRLRLALPDILATRTGVLAPRLLHLRTSPPTGGISISASTRPHHLTTVAAIGTGDLFSKGRDFGAWLGLVPKQISTGDRTILGKISRRGNRYLRALF